MDDTNAIDNSRAGEKTRLYVGISYAICCIVWGTTWYATRVSVEPGDGLPPIFAGAFRFLVAIFCYLPIILIYRKRLTGVSKQEFAWICLAGLFNGCYQCFIYSAECTISGGLASVIMATAPLMVAAVAFLFRVEKVRRFTMIGFCIALAGVSLVCFDRLNSANDQFAGICLALAAAFFTSLSNVTLKRQGTSVHPLSSAMIFLVATDIPVWIASLLAGERWNLFPLNEHAAPLFAILYMAILSSIIAFMLYLYMLRHMSLMAISTLQFVLPVFALIVDMFLEKRVVLSPQVWIGIVVVMIGVAVSMRRH